MALDQAINELSLTLAGNRAASNWRWLVRQRLSAVRDALDNEQARSWDGWLAARATATDRDRRRLLARLSALGPRVLERADLETAHAEVRRLAEDLQHYRQRLHDLMYDSVALELGGSE